MDCFGSPGRSPTCRHVAEKQTTFDLWLGFMRGSIGKTSTQAGLHEWPPMHSIVHPCRPHRCANGNDRWRHEQTRYKGDMSNQTSCPSIKDNTK